MRLKAWKEEPANPGEGWKRMALGLEVPKAKEAEALGGERDARAGSLKAEAEEEVSAEANAEEKLRTVGGRGDAAPPGAEPGGRCRANESEEETIESSWEAIDEAGWPAELGPKLLRGRSHKWEQGEKR